MLRIAISFKYFGLAIATFGFCAQTSVSAQSHGPGTPIGRTYSFISDDVNTPARSPSRHSTSVITGEKVNDSESQGGYFPTGLESRILANSAGRSADYPRAFGDRRAWTYSGLWAVRPAQDNFYQRNAIFDRVERFLGPFIPDENLLAAHDSGRVFSMTGNYGLGFLTRDVSPERSMFKAGPLVMDFLGVNTTFIYTSYSGDTPLSGVDSSGWIGMIGLPVRASLRLTDTIYFQLSGMFYWLPLENKFGIASGLGSNWNLGLNGRLNHEFQWQGTSFRIYDYLTSAGNFMDMIEPWQVNEVDEVGRYRFGIPHIDQGSAGRGIYWNPRFGGVSNVVGFEAQREAWNDWWVYGNLAHTDFWGASSFNLDDHTHLEQLSLDLLYVGDDYWFSPRFTYLMNSTDYFNSLIHQISAQFTGRFTEYLNGWASVGYLWQTGRRDSNVDTVPWEVGVNHDLTEYTKHSLSGGQVYTLSPSLDEVIADYLRYTISHAFGPRLSATAHFQYTDGRVINRASMKSETYQTGLHLNYAIAPDTNLTAGTNYAVSHSPGASVDQKTWLHFLTLQRPLLGRLNSAATYQYIDQSGPVGSNFTEHMLALSLNFAF